MDKCMAIQNGLQAMMGGNSTLSLILNSFWRKFIGIQITYHKMCEIQFKRCVYKFINFAFS